MRIKSIVLLTSVMLMSGCVWQKTYDREHELNNQLESELGTDQAEIQQLKDRLRVTIEDQILYPEGQATLSKSGKAILDRLTPTLSQATDHRIEVEGYTDSVPIGRHLRSKYKTNWELSAARAASVVEYLQKKGIDPSRMTAAGHGQYQPTADNGSADGRAENRRTDIDLVPIYNQN